MARVQGGGGPTSAKKVLPPIGGKGPPRPAPPPKPVITSYVPPRIGKAVPGLQPIGGRAGRYTPDIYPPEGGRGQGQNNVYVEPPPPRKVRVSKNFQPTVRLDPGQIQDRRNQPVTNEMIADIFGLNEPPRPQKYPTPRSRQPRPTPSPGPAEPWVQPYASQGPTGVGQLRPKPTPQPAPKPLTPQGRIDLARTVLGEVGSRGGVDPGSMPKPKPTAKPKPKRRK